MPTNKKYLYLASEVHVPTGEKPEKPGDPLPVKTVGPGVLANLDLTDAEIKKLPKSILRPATADEIEHAESQEKHAERIALVADQEAEVANLKAEQDRERVKLEQGGKLATPEQQAKLAETHSKAVTALQEKHVRALNKFDGAE